MPAERYGGGSDGIASCSRGTLAGLARSPRAGRAHLAAALPSANLAPLPRRTIRVVEPKPTIEALLREVNRELAPRFEDRLRAALAGSDPEWLIDQIVRLALDAHSLQALDRRLARAEVARRRAERATRVAALGLDARSLAAFVERHPRLDRAGAVGAGHLSPDAPAKGTDLIGSAHRTRSGEDLLRHAKDVLFALLFGDEATNTRLHRIQRELLTLTLPRFKAGTLDFMRASTELAAAGTWQDPDAVSNDIRADNVIIEVEFGEIAGELVGRGVVHCLSIINNLEVNEQVLYARMVNVEESTLIE